jgi:hypothetical protein
MAGSVALTSSKAGAGVRKYSLDWLSDASGAVSGNSVTLPPGTIIAVTFTPDSGGTQPTDLYDVTMTCDVHGVNILDNGAGTSIGADLSNTTGTHKVPFIQGATETFVRQWAHGGGYTLVVAAAGNAKGGIVDVYIAPGVL